MKKILVLLGTVFAFTGLSLGIASAQTAPPCDGSTFDTFATGTVNNQGGWHVLGGYDQEVVPNTYNISGFGCKSLRISDATTSTAIYDQVFSNPATSETGETSAIDSNGATGIPHNRHFEAQFDLASVTQAEQPGMHLSVSPDRGDGTRMSSLGFTDSASGINVYFDDVTGTTSPVSFNNTQIATNLTRATPHTVKFVMDFLEGPSNDVVKIYIDGNLVHTGTSWENFYRYDAGAYPTPTATSSRTVNSLVFYERGTASPANLFNGYLIDNVSLLSTATTTTSAPPVITLTGSSTMTINQGATFTDPGATAVDSNSNPLTVTATGTVNTAVIGDYTITYTATDSSSNTATTTRTVSVVAVPSSTSTPVITLNGSSTMSIIQGSVFTDPGATATVGTTTIGVTATGTVNTSVVGSYTITYTATNASSTATATRTVNVVAASTGTSTSVTNGPITITLNGSSTINLITGTTFTDPGASAVEGSTTLPVTSSSNLDIHVIGQYTVTYTSTDSSGNSASVTRTVNILPNPSAGGGVYSNPTSSGGSFVYTPVVTFVPSTTATGTTGTNITPVSIGLVTTPTGQVLGVATVNFTRNLKIGLTGDDVMELQKYLISQGYLTISVPTKYFGRLTQNALKKWQKKMGLPSTGYFGPLSRGAINK